MSSHVFQTTKGFSYIPTLYFSVNSMSQGVSTKTQNMFPYVASFDKKDSHFPRFGLKIFVIAAKAAKAQKLVVRDGLLHVVRVGQGKQHITL